MEKEKVENEKVEKEKVEKEKVEKEKADEVVIVDEKDVLAKKSEEAPSKKGPWKLFFLNFKKKEWKRYSW